MEFSDSAIVHPLQGVGMRTVHDGKLNVRTMRFPKTNGWQLSRDSVPAVVARTCPLRCLVSLWVVHAQTADIQNQGRLYLIRYAGKVDVVPSRRDRREYARLAAQFLVVDGIIPTCSSGHTRSALDEPWTEGR